MLTLNFIYCFELKTRPDTDSVSTLVFQLLKLTTGYSKHSIPSMLFASFNFKGNPSSVLLSVLDPEQNKFFSDNYLEEDYD